MSLGVERLRQKIEFEFRRSNFVEHVYDPNGCDLIAGWQHDWPDCPLEVVELRRVIETLDDESIRFPSIEKSRVDISCRVQQPNDLHGSGSSSIEDEVLRKAANRPCP